MEKELGLNISVVIATLFLRSVSNWIYELLKGRLFPDKANFRAVIRVFLASIPFILLIAFQQFSQESKKAILEALNSPIPLW